jgi:hypothetical protein
MATASGLGSETTRFSQAPFDSPAGDSKASEDCKN